MVKMANLTLRVFHHNLFRNSNGVHCLSPRPAGSQRTLPMPRGDTWPCLPATCPRVLSALGRAEAARRKGAKLTPLGSPATQAGPDTELVLSKDAWQGKRVGEREEEQTDRHTRQRRTDTAPSLHHVHAYSLRTKGAF